MNCCRNVAGVFYSEFSKCPSKYRRGIGVEVAEHIEGGRRKTDEVETLLGAEEADAAVTTHLVNDL